MALKDLRQSTEQNQESQAHDLLKKPVDSETQQEHSHESRPADTASVKGRIQSWESRTTSKSGAGGTKGCASGVQSRSGAPNRR